MNTFLADNYPMVIYTMIVVFNAVVIYTIVTSHVGIRINWRKNCKDREF